MKHNLHHAAAGAALLCLVASGAQAQIKEIPSEGLKGIPKDAIEFAPEHDYRRENNLGQSVPAAPGTKPGSTDPRNIAGTWIHGKVYTVNADGSFTYSEGLPRAAGAAGAAPGGVGGPPGGAAPGGTGGPQGGPQGGPPGGGGLPGAGGPAGGGTAPVSCAPSAPFTVGMPGEIVQTPGVIYIFKNGANGNYRRIVLNGQHPANPVPSYGGHSIGHWDGDTLVVETVGLKGSLGVGGMGGGGAGGNFTAQSKVVERIHKIDNNMTIEDMVTITDPALKAPVLRRLTAYYRPDLKVVEAPCEEYSDPFEGQYSAPPGGNSGAKR
ncbi:MAG: hypothetical protein QM718_03065 [Steroidobacteraceae bacterium]